MIFDRLEKRDAAVPIDINDWSTVYNFEHGYEGLFDKNFEESDYFKCIRIISSSVAKVPLLVKQSTEHGEIIARDHPLFNLLKNRPNPFMSSVDFLKSIEATRQHNGESASLITRDFNGKVTGLYPINIIEILIDDVGLCKSTKIVSPILVTYSCGTNGTNYYCRYDEILHFKGFTLDGMTSMSVRKRLRTTIETAISAKNYQKDLFSNGLTNKAVVQLTSDIKEEKELKKIQAKFNRMYSGEGRIMTVPAGYTVTPLNLNLADAEFTALKKLSTTDIATAFGVPLYLMGILDGYNNNAMEQASLSFLNDTLQILFTSIEQEGDYKLFTDKDHAEGYYLEFDTTALYKVDSKTLTEILTSQVQNGITRPNEARRKLGYEDDINGNELLMHSGMMPLSSALTPVTSLPVAKDVSKADTTLPPAVVDSVEQTTGDKLNGAQVQSLITVIKSVKDGSIGKGAALEIITSSFGISEDKALKILNDAT